MTDKIDEEDNLSMRDKFAIEIFKIISDKENSKVYAYKFGGKEDGHKYQKDRRHLIEREMRVAYDLADLMRKVRLGVFE